MQNVPASAPAVAHADSRPTTVPLAARSPSCSLTTTGVTALSTVAGGSSANTAIASAPPCPEPSNASPQRRTSGTVASASSPPVDEQRGEQPARVDLVRGPAAHRRAERDAGQHDADDRRVGLERQPDVRREQPDAEDLEHEHRARRAEHGRRGEPAGQRAGPGLRAHRGSCAPRQPTAAAPASTAASSASSGSAPLAQPGGERAREHVAGAGRVDDVDGRRGSLDRAVWRAPARAARAERDDDRAHAERVRGGRELARIGALRRR